MSEKINENNLSPLDIYKNSVFKLLIVCIPSIALCAGLTFTVLHLMGFYPDTSSITMFVFDCTCVIYTFLGIIFNRICEDENHRLIPIVSKIGKIFIAVLMAVQWNFITYMIPSRDFWAYSFFFVLLAALFLDNMYILIIIAEILVSMLVSWMVKPDELLPYKDEYFIPEMVLRFVLIVLCFGTIWLMVLTIEKRLTKELEKVSDFDTLTLLYNRRKLNKYFDDALKKNKGKFSVIMSDIDNFKKVNDTYTHSCGDEVLKDIAYIMRNVSDGKGIAFRYGGEEMLVLVYADEEEAFNVAEEIRKRVETHTTSYEDKSIGVTLTLGVAECCDTDTLESLIKRADTNLYYGKSHGKNCVIK